MQELDFDKIIVQPVFTSLSNGKDVSVSVLRLDLIHPVISGNKWFKLKYYLEEAKQQDKKIVISFGGAWSNHIVAVACACFQHNLKSIGIIRGEKPAEYSSTLRAAQNYGMSFRFMERKNYKDKMLPDEIPVSDSYIIPEGGFGIKGAEGFATALNFCNKNEYTHFICAAGTGTMMAGIIKDAQPGQQVKGISVLKNNADLLPAIMQLLTPDEKKKNHALLHEYHFDGYAKHTEELLQFMNSFYQGENIPSDFVYTGKLFFAVQDLLQKNYFPAGSKILVIHSGGLQGNASLPQGKLIF